MKKTASLFWVCLGLCLIAAPRVRAESRAETLYHEAEMKETGERDPEAAIPLYQQAIDLADSDPRLRSAALLHMARCLERVGKPKEAETMYLTIVQDSVDALADTVQTAQTSLKRLQAIDKKEQEEAAREAARPKEMVLSHEFQETRFSFLAGPSWIGSGHHTAGDFALALRYRLSQTGQPLRLWSEVGGFMPWGNSTIAEETKSFESQATDRASLKWQSQLHLALIAELPHGIQETVLPELGIGAALTMSDIDYVSSVSGSQSQQTWSPYLTAGVRLFADRRWSVLLAASYTANPYSKSVDIPSPAHTQTFGFPTALWSIGAQVQLKVGWTKTVMRPKE